MFLSVLLNLDRWPTTDDMPPKNDSSSAGVQGCRATRLQGYRNTGIQVLACLCGCELNCVHVSMCERACNRASVCALNIFAVSFACMGVSAHIYARACLRMCVHVRVRVRMRARARVYVRVRVRVRALPATRLSFVSKPRRRSNVCTWLPRSLTCRRHNTTSSEHHHI